MKTIARYLIWITFTLSGVVLIVQPFAVWFETGELDPKILVLRAFLAFTLVFCGAEASERLKERWTQKPEKRRIQEHSMR